MLHYKYTHKHRICRSLVALLFAFSCLSDAQSQDDWVKYIGEVDRRFSVQVPDAMKVHSKTISTAVGELETIAYTCEGGAEDKNKLYLINQVDYPLGTFPEDSTSLTISFLEESITTAAKRIGAKVLYINDAEKEGPPAYIFRLKYNDGSAAVKGFTTIVDDTFYMLQVYCHSDDSLNDEMDIFLRSFRILE